MNTTSFNYHFIPPADLNIQTRQFPVFPKRTVEQQEIKVKIKKKKDWLLIGVTALGIATVGSFAFAFYKTSIRNPIENTQVVKHKDIPTAKRITPTQPSIQPLNVQALPVIDADTLPSTKVQSVVADSISMKESPKESTTKNEPTNTTKVNEVLPSSSTPKIDSGERTKANVKAINTKDADRLKTLPTSLKDINKVALPHGTPKFLSENEVSKTPKSGIFKRPQKNESVDNNTGKTSPKNDSSPQSIF